MFIERISAGLIGSRIDASFYDPIYLEAETAIKEYNHTQLSKVTNFIKKGVFDMPSHLYGDAGVPFLRISDFDGLAVDIDNAIKIPRWKHEEEYKTKLIGGDIVISKVGTTGEIAKVPAGCEVNVSQNLIAVSIDHEKIDGDYLLALLKSEQLNKAIERHVTTIVQGKLTLDIIRELVIPLFVPLAQKYIGDKVRQAEQLRAWARRLRASVDDKLNNLNLPINEPPQLLNRVSVQTMEDRLDPRPYRSHYLHLVNEIEKLPHDSISSVVGLASGCPVSSKDFLENAGIPLVRIRNIGFDDFIGLDTGVSKDVYQDASKYQAKEKMVVVGMDGIFRSQFFVADELPMLVNQRVAMLVPRKIRGELLTHWLNRPEGQMQLNQWAVKTTVEHTSLSDIGRVLIPRLDENLENKLADDLLNARLAYRYAKFLTQTAKTLVEALIEGQLTELQLIQAQQALEDGDNSLDQAILSKLSNQGYAIEGATPLFSDIDELYRLLESAAQTEAEE